MFSACVNSEGQVWTWGNNDDFQLGHSGKKASKTPKLVADLPLCQQVSCTRGYKYHHMSVLTTEGEVFSWGSAYKGKLGNASKWSHGEPTHYKKPARLEVDWPVTRVICGGIHNAVVDTDGQLYTYGCGSDGRLGH